MYVCERHSQPGWAYKTDVVDSGGTVVASSDMDIQFHWNFAEVWHDGERISMILSTSGKAYPYDIAVHFSSRRVER